MNLEDLTKILLEKKSTISKIEREIIGSEEHYTFSVKNLFFKVYERKVDSSTYFHSLTISEEPTFAIKNILTYYSYNKIRNPDEAFCENIFYFIKDLHRDRIIDYLKSE